MDLLGFFLFAECSTDQPDFGRAVLVEFSAEADPPKPDIVSISLHGPIYSNRGTLRPFFILMKFLD